MLNNSAKYVLALTSLSPVFLTMAINYFEHGEPWTIWIWWIAATIVSVVFCWGLMRYIARKAQINSVLIKDFERKDQEMLAFLFIYLLPITRSENLALSDNILTSCFVLFVTTLAIVCARAFHFNPVMRLVFRYRFYSVKDSRGIPNLLISRTDFQRSGVEIKTVMVTQNVHLHIGDRDA